MRSIEEMGTQYVEDDIVGEYYALINYCMIGLMLLEKSDILKDELNYPLQEIMNYYYEYAKECYTLMSNKNRDYGEAWREMRLSSITDLIILKILRIKQIENNDTPALTIESLQVENDENLY